MFKGHPSLPDDMRVIQYCQVGELHPTVFSNWREECRSWKETAYLSANISTEMPMLHVKGPDAAKLMDYYCTSNMKDMPIGSAKHAVMCAPSGNIMTEGVALRLAEDDYGCYALQPIVNFLANSGKYDVEPIEITEYDYIYQVAGPKSLEILEQAAQEDLHDIRFMRFRNATIAGHEVRILRMGMAGTLGYEVHGTLADDPDLEVYNHIWEVGEPLGLRKLGYTSYSYDHAENGFPQSGMHYMFAWKDWPELWEAVQKGLPGAPMSPDMMPLSGSMAEECAADLSNCYCNPIELKQGHSINWDHDFLGKEALEKIRDGRHRELVTLVWDVDDIMDIQRSFYEEEEPYKEIVYPLFFPNEGVCGTHHNKVLDADGNLVGKASFPEYSITYKKLFSLAVVDPEFTELGTELTLVWGSPEDRKKNVRVTVDRYPLLELKRNEAFDVEQVPHFKQA